MRATVAHVARLGIGSGIVFARRQRKMWHLDFETPQLRSRRSGVSRRGGSPGAPLFPRNKPCKRNREEPMKIARIVSFVVAAAGMFLQAGAAQAAVKTQWIDYKQGNTPLSGYLVYDDAVQGPRPGVLMIHDRSGFSEGTLGDARMIAGLGYVVFAEDIFGKGIAPKTVPEMMETIGIYDKDRALMRARALAGLDVLKAQPMVDPSKLASVGYCFGGTTGMELIETGAPLLGFVSVHGAFNNFAAEAAKHS